MKEIRYFIIDILNNVQLRIKLLISNRLLIFSMCIFFCIATIVSSTFFVTAKDNSSIPVGIVDLDNSTHSKLVIKNMEKVKLVRTTVGTKEQLIDKLKKGELNAVFVIKKGLAYNIESQNINKIVEAYYLSDTSYAKLLSDIVLSTMLDDICYNYAKGIYYKNQIKLDYVYTEDEYRERIESQYDSQDKTIGFDFDVLNLEEQKSVNKDIDTSLIYRQIVIGIVALILLVLCLLVGNIILDDYKNKVNLRRRTTKMSSTALLIGDIASMWGCIFVFVVFSGIFLINKICLVDKWQKIKFILIMTLFVGTISMVFVMITRLIEDIIAYQFVSALVMLILGISASAYILGFLIDGRIVEITKYTPFGLLINGYKNIILNNSIKTNIIGYVFTIIVIYLVTYIIQIVKGDRINCES